MKSFLSIQALALNCLLFSFGQLAAQELFLPSNCEASGTTIQIKQADNSLLSIVGKGNMNQSWTETTDGYTIIDVNGIYEYAELKNSNLVSTGVRAKNVGQRTASDLATLATLPKSVKPEAIALKGSVLAQARKLIKGKSFPTTGNIRVLALLIDFPDLNNTYSASSVDSLLNHSGHRNGGASFVSYYDSASNGQLKITVDVYGWYRAANGYKYYSDSAGTPQSQILVKEAVDAAEAAGVDFSNYDNDSDGYVDGIMAIHAGPGAEEGSQRKYIWSHRWVLGSQSAYYDGKNIYDYMINPETRKGNLKNLVGIGVFCHEFGHNLGLPDLYDTDPGNGTSQGIGEWGLMGGGSWLGGEHYPSNFSAWSKMELSWDAPRILNIGDSGFYSLKASDLQNEIFRVNHPFQSTEYFLLENRQKTKLDTALPGTGMAIWHINTLKTFSGNSVNADENDKGVDLEEADADDDMDHFRNRGDDSDLYPGTSSNSRFDDNTYPNAHLNANNSGLILSNIREINEVIYFSLGNIVAKMSLPQDTIVLDAIANSQDTLMILSNAKWKLSNSSNWLQISKLTDSADAEVPLIAQGNSGAVRYTTVFLRNEMDELMDQVVIKQLELSDYLTANKQIIYLASNGNPKDSFQINSNLNWSISSNSNWFNFTPSSGQGNAMVAITANKNSTFGSRMDSLSISASGGLVPDQKIKIVQAGDLFLSPKYLLLGATKGSLGEFVASTSEDTLLFSSSQPWLSFTISTLTGSPDSFLVSVISDSTNTTANNRIAYILVYNSLQQDTVWVEQQTAVPYFKVSTDTVYLDKDQGSIAYFDIMSNISWSISENTSWLICNPISSKDHQTVELKSSTKNSSGNPRMALITLKAVNFPDIELIVVQKASNPLLSISKDSILLGSDSADVQYFSISSNLEYWELSETSNWFKIDPDISSFTQMIEVMALDSNKSGVRRMDSIILSAAPFAPIVIKVSQDTIQSVGIADQKLEDQLKIYPNPNYGELNIDFEEYSVNNFPIELTIFNSVGEAVKQASLHQSKNLLDLNALGKGIYFVRIQMDNQLLLKKVSLLR